MSSSNSFNICPRCGNSNIMNAKYCARCGSQLKLPEDPIVCHNCRTRNTPMANFCRNCGAELKVGYATKICARCGNEVPAEQNICTCGYMFAQNAYATPLPVRADGTVDTTGVTATGADSKKRDAAADKKAKKEQKKQAKLEKKENAKNRVYSHKGGRAYAIVALVLLLVFAYLVVAPAVARPTFLSDFDGGFSFNPHQENNGTTTDDIREPLYGYGLVRLLIDAITGESFGDTFAVNGGTAHAVMAVLVVIFALAVLIHLIVCVVRIIRPRRSRKPNWCLFALALLTSVVAGLIAVFNYMEFTEGFLAQLADIFKLTGEWILGNVIFVIPAYFWFFFLYSLVAKARVLKEETIAPSTEISTAA